MITCKTACKHDACNLSPRKDRQKGQKFKAILSYIGSLRREEDIGDIASEQTIMWVPYACAWVTNNTPIHCKDLSLVLI